MGKRERMERRKEVRLKTIVTMAKQAAALTMMEKTLRSMTMAAEATSDPTRPTIVLVAASCTHSSPRTRPNSTVFGPDNGPRSAEENPSEKLKALREEE